MDKKDWNEGIKISEKIFEKLRGKNSNPGLRGIPMYMAYTVAKDGIKCFEINSRGGMPETQNLMPILKDDFIEACFNIIDGKLTKLNFEPKATVVIYKVPPTYGGREKEFTGDTRVDLTDAMRLSENYDGNFKLYPCSMELRNNEIFALKSRTICTVGIGNSIQEARKIAIEGVDAIKGASLWYRTDIASEEHIRKSIEHVKKLRNH
jgi:phosphoribosylamine--glycine ligase